MKYVEDLINEAKDVITRFEESKDLVLCCGAKNLMEQIVNKRMLGKYDSAIRSVVLLRDFLVELTPMEYEEQKHSMGQGSNTALRDMKFKEDAK